MNTEWRILTIISLIISFLLFGWSSEVISRNGSGGLPPGGTSPTPTIPAPMHPVVPPPQYFKRWSVTEIVSAFQEQGLEITNIKPIAEADRGSLPAEPDNAIRFSIPSFKDDTAGCILSFENIDALEKVRKHYIGLNEKDKRFNWTFVKDNILLILDGTIPEAKAREYERALYDL